MQDYWENFVEAIAEIKGIPVILDLNAKKSKKLSNSIFEKFNIKPLTIQTDVSKIK